MPVWERMLFVIIGMLSFYMLNGLIVCFTGDRTIKESYRYSLHGGNKKQAIPVTLLGGIAALSCCMTQADGLAGVTLFIFFALLTVVTVVDLAVMEIPNELVLAIFILGIISCFTMPGLGIWSRVIGFFCVSVPLLLITMAIPGAFGGGDIKLMAVCGILLGWKLNLMALAMGILTGGLYGIWLLAAKKKERKEHFAFGPFLCVGIVIAWFFGERIIEWYIGFF